MGTIRCEDPHEQVVKTRTRRLAARAAVVCAVLSLAIIAGAQGAASSKAPPAVAAGNPSLGALQVRCPPMATNCCPGTDCNVHPELLPASPYLVVTANGYETISRQVIKIGQHFTITFVPTTPSTKEWTFPDIAKKTSSCRHGVDRTCSYVALANDVTYPAFSDFNGWSQFMWNAGNINGNGVGFGDYAILGKNTPVSGRLADKHGKGIARGGFPNDIHSPDPGVFVLFYVKQHGKLVQTLNAAAPRIHGSAAHPYDVGYYGLLLKPGTYTVLAGDPAQHISCSKRVLHVHSSEIKNFDLRCSRK